MADHPHRRVNHDAKIQLRLDRPLASSVAAAATGKGVNVSEFLRAVLRREVEQVIAPNSQRIRAGGVASSR